MFTCTFYVDDYWIYFAHFFLQSIFVFILKTNIHSYFKERQKQRAEIVRNRLIIFSIITLDRIVFLKHVRTCLVSCLLVITILDCDVRREKQFLQNINMEICFNEKQYNR